MKTLPREPWRGGQICGEQLEYGVVPGRLVFCGEYKKVGSPACEVHDQELRDDNYGVLPKFAEGNALGLRITSCSESWHARDHFDEIVGAERTRDALADRFGFTLKWEPDVGIKPVEPTPEELAAFEAQLGES